MSTRSHAIEILFAILFILTGCAPPTGDDSNPPGSGIFTKAPTEEHVVETTIAHADSSTTTRKVPNNQIMLMFADTVSADAAAATLARMQSDLAGVGLRSVGQIPDLGIYQLEITNDATDPVASMAALDDVMETLRTYPDVVTVGYNELLIGRAIENDDDNSATLGYDRCAMAVLDYYQAIPLFDRVLPHISLSDVTVAVIDSGLWVESGQFDDILPRTQFPGVSYPAEIPYDWHLYKHGTNVAALIAADNGDGLTNGVALRVLGERLHLIVGEAHIWGNLYSLARCLARTQEAVQLGADIVNISLGLDDPRGRPSWLPAAQAQFDRLFNASPDVLFIAAAANDRTVLNGNDVPAGMPNANLLTVGGFQSCNPDQTYFMSATGAAIEIAGPATDIPGFVGDNMTGPARYNHSGNSFAAPLVASIAAIVKSIEPGLSGAQLKARLLSDDQTWSASADVGGRRPALLKTVGTVLLNHAAASGTVDDILDAYGPADNISDPSGYSINRMSGNIEFTVTGPSHNVTVTRNAQDITWNADQLNYGLIGMGGQVILKIGASSGSDQVMFNTTTGFRLNDPYTSKLQIIVQSSEGRLGTGVDGGTGTFSFCECELTTRSLPLDWFSPAHSGPHQIVFIQAAGTFSGSNQGSVRESDGRITHGVTYNASGSFNTAFMLMFPDAATMNYLERHCVGGYLLGVPEP